MTKYDLEYLLIAFKNHAEQLDKLIEDTDKEFPSREKAFHDDFNISSALLTICEEIKKIKDVLND